jgi:hypothetical protein
MHRRQFFGTAASAGLAAAPAAAAARAIFEMRWFRLRNGSQVQRTNEFLGKYFLPAAQRLGIGPLGFFNSLIAEQGPFVLALLAYPSMNAVIETADRMASDREFQKGFEEYNSMSELSYIRMENSLLRAFETTPAMTPPPAAKAPRVFEIRTYESNNGKAGKTKIKMFNEGEIDVFKRVGALPVFFAETIVGRNLPNLTYMLSYEDLPSRDKIWKAFGADPQWQKMRAQPEYADALIVSNISNAIVRPAPYSQIR